MFDNLNNLEYFLMSKASDWKIFDGVLPKKNMRPSDIDSYVERNGNTLFLEEKHDNGTIPVGQSITINNWTNAPDKFVLVLWFEPVLLYDADGKEIMHELGFQMFERKYYRMQIYMQGMEVYSRAIDNNSKPIRFYQNFFYWATKHPYLTKQQMLDRIENGITLEDRKELLKGLVNFDED